MNEPEIILDRTTYKAVKAMDRQKMEQWINNVYISGLNDASDDGVSMEELQNTIAKVEGIDETRLKAIMTAIGELYKSKKKK